MGFAHPARTKLCVFCNRWTGNANLKLKNPNVGYEFNGSTLGKCSRNNGTFPANSRIADKCEFYDPSMEARRLL